MSESDPEELPWPAAALALLNELRHRPGRIALVVGAGATDTLTTIGEALGTAVSSVGQRLTSETGAPNPLQIQERLNDMTLLDDLDILFAPQMKTNPWRLLRSLAREAPRIAAWPGAVQDGRAVYSAPGRFDYFNQRLEDAIVLRPHRRTLPTELPFSVERFAA